MPRKTGRNENTSSARKNSVLVEMLDGADVRAPQPRKLFILEEGEINSLIRGTVIFQFLIFVGGTLINKDVDIFLIQNLSISTEIIGGIVSFLGFLLWILMVHKKLQQWKRELVKNSL